MVTDQQSVFQSSPCFRIGAAHFADRQVEDCLPGLPHPIEGYCCASPTNGFAHLVIQTLDCGPSIDRCRTQSGEVAKSSMIKCSSRYLQETVNLVHC